MYSVIIHWSPSFVSINTPLNMMNATLLEEQNMKTFASKN